MQPSKTRFWVGSLALVFAPTICYAHGEQGIEIAGAQACVTACFFVAALIGRKLWQGGICILVLAAAVLSWPLVTAIWGNHLPDIAVLTAIGVPLIAGASAYLFALRRRSKDKNES